MELCSLHPLDPDLVGRYVRAIVDEDAPLLATADAAWTDHTLRQARRGYEQALTGDETGANAVSFGLARVLATAQPTFLQPGLSLTALEARIDRGVGMLLRPPARLFGDAGLTPVAARTMPIRLDLSRGLMGGAFVPARLVPDLEHLIDRRAGRFLRRLEEAELDPVPTLGLLITACAYAREHGLGLYEAMDVVIPDAPAGDPPGARVIVADRKAMDPGLRRQLEAVAKAEKPPGLMKRLFRRARGPASLDGRGPST